MKDYIMRYHYTSIRMAKIQNTDNTECCEDVGQQKLSFTAGGNVKWYSHFRNSLVVSYKTKQLLTYDCTITLLGIYSKELGTCVYTKTCTQMFMAALFMIAQTWKQPRYPSVGEWINCDTSRQWNII